MCHVGPTLVDALTERKEQPDVIFPLSQPVGLKSLPFFLFLFLSFFFLQETRSMVVYPPIFGKLLAESMAKEHQAWCWAWDGTFTHYCYRLFRPNAAAGHKPLNEASKDARTPRLGGWEGE
jgi:hypothetical protein